MELFVFLAVVVVVGVVTAARNGTFRKDDESGELRRRVWQDPAVHARGSAQTGFSDARPGWSERHNRSER